MMQCVHRTTVRGIIAIHACMHAYIPVRKEHTHAHTHLPPLDVHPVDPLQLAHLDSLVLSVAAGEVPVDASALYDILPSGTGDDGRTDVRSGTGSLRHDALNFVIALLKDVQ